MIRPIRSLSPLNIIHAVHCVTLDTPFELSVSIAWKTTSSLALLPSSCLIFCAFSPSSNPSDCPNHQINNHHIHNKATTAWSVRIPLITSALLIMPSPFLSNLSNIDIKVFKSSGWISKDGLQPASTALPSDNTSCFEEGSAAAAWVGGPKLEPRRTGTDSARTRVAAVAFQPGSLGVALSECTMLGRQPLVMRKLNPLLPCENREGHA